MRSAIVASFLVCVSLVSAFPTDPSTSQPDPPCGYPKPDLSPYLSGAKKARDTRKSADLGG
ncbi:hypothetical protein PCANC_16932 [Puccinia coronata f. sp. avenae]|uniref:Uncharacterized protein n=1 Tax=Puccinia coronata f. sp. avenae TaxID=200324 RepID=A0A2N5V5N1_9BASI|nr:hypothetical protein PCANC_28267 [Puccinia coronata f. sp. avenae]PLW45290.1 hypothetical protein PCANC_16932 [Puccinia coronata f. sp. avenae]